MASKSSQTFDPIKHAPPQATRNGTKRNQGEKQTLLREAHFLEKRLALPCRGLKTKVENKKPQNEGASSQETLLSLSPSLGVAALSPQLCRQRESEVLCELLTILLKGGPSGALCVKEISNRAPFSRRRETQRTPSKPDAAQFHFTSFLKASRASWRSFSRFAFCISTNSSTKRRRMESHSSFEMEAPPRQRGSEQSLRRDALACSTPFLPRHSRPRLATASVKRTSCPATPPSRRCESAHGPCSPPASVSERRCAEKAETPRAQLPDSARRPRGKRLKRRIFQQHTATHFLQTHSIFARNFLKTLFKQLLALFRRNREEARLEDEARHGLYRQRRRSARRRVFLCKDFECAFSGFLLRGAPFRRRRRGRGFLRGAFA